MTPSEAERFDEVVIVSIPMGRYREVPTDAIGGKVVIDTNNYYPQRDGHPRSWTVTGRPPASCCKHTSRRSCGQGVQRTAEVRARLAA
jgi:predicted dinucleotide-binding enzyme